MVEMSHSIELGLFASGILFHSSLEGYCISQSPDRGINTIMYE